MMSDDEWRERFPNFNRRKLRCQHTGIEGIDLDFLDDVQLLRNKYGKPMIETSGYRHPDHPIEARKKSPGEHSDGLAIDLYIPTEDFLWVSAMWYEMGYGRIGWNPGKFIHLGGSLTRPQTVWVY